MKRLSVIIPAIVIVVALVAFWWTGRSTEDTGKPNSGEVTAKSPPPPSPTRKRRPGLPEASGRTSEGDVPKSIEEAQARPEVVRNKTMAELRQSFAAGRHDVVIQKAKDYLAIDPDEAPARALLAMSLCASNDEAGAREQFEKLPEARQKFVARKCSSLGIELP